MKLVNDKFNSDYQFDNFCLIFCITKKQINVLNVNYFFVFFQNVLLQLNEDVLPNDNQLELQDVFATLYLHVL